MADGMMLIINDNGEAEIYDDTYDLTIHCTSEEEKDEALRRLNSMQWIPCSERLPEQEEKSYWVCTNDGYQCQCRWTNINPFRTDLTTSWHWHVMDIPQHSKVVAWMPLPAIWEEGESNG